MSQFPRGPVRSQVFVFGPRRRELSISSGCPARRPLSAVVRAEYVDFAPEAGRYRNRRDSICHVVLTVKPPVGMSNRTLLRENRKHRGLERKRLDC